MLELVGRLLHRIGKGLQDSLHHGRLLARGLLARGLLGEGLNAQGHRSGQGSFGIGLGLGKFCLGCGLSLLLSLG